MLQCLDNYWIAQRLHETLNTAPPGDPTSLTTLPIGTCPRDHVHQTSVSHSKKMPHWMWFALQSLLWCAFSVFSLATVCCHVASGSPIIWKFALQSTSQLRHDIMNFLEFSEGRCKKTMMEPIQKKQQKTITLLRVIPTMAFKHCIRTVSWCCFVMTRDSIWQLRAASTQCVFWSVIMICEDGLRWCFVMMYCDDALWRCFVMMFCDNVLWSYFVMMYCDDALWKWSVIMICDDALWWRWSVMMFCEDALWWWFVKMFCDDVLW